MRERKLRKNPVFQLTMHDIQHSRRLSQILDIVQNLSANQLSVNRSDDLMSRTQVRTSSARGLALDQSPNSSNCQKFIATTVQVYFFQRDNSACVLFPTRHKIHRDINSSRHECKCTSTKLNETRRVYDLAVT